MISTAYRAPAGRVVQDSLADQILTNREDMRNNRCFPIGKMLSLMSAQDDSARYATEKSVRDRIAAVSKLRGLQLEWPQTHAPHISWNRQKNSVVFPFGCVKPPRISDPRYRGNPQHQITQDITDYASGYIAGKDGTIFASVQPVIYLAAWILDGIYVFVAHPDPVNGKYPALLISERTAEAHIVYGKLELTSASAAPEMYKPWEHRGTGPGA